MKPSEFKGVPIYFRSAGGVSLHASSFHDSEYVDFHRHESPYICFLWHGVLTEQIGGQSRRCGPSSLILHPPNEVHSNRFEGKGFCLNLQLSSRWCARMGLDESVFASRVITRGPLMVLCSTMMRALLSFQDPLDLEELGLQFATSMEMHSRFSRRSPSWMPSVLERVHDGAARPVSLSKCAQAAGVHPVYFARAFRRAVGSSLGDYQRRARLQKAASLLTSTDLDICEIALRCGFSDQSHFTKQLARQLKLTPGNLRRHLGRSMVPNVQDSQAFAP